MPRYIQNAFIPNICDNHLFICLAWTLSSLILAVALSQAMMLKPVCLHYSVPLMSAFDGGSLPPMIAFYWIDMSVAENKLLRILACTNLSAFVFLRKNASDFCRAGGAPPRSRLMGKRSAGSPKDSSAVKCETAYCLHYPCRLKIMQSRVVSFPRHFRPAVCRYFACRRGSSRAVTRLLFEEGLAIGPCGLSWEIVASKPCFLSRLSFVWWEGRDTCLGEGSGADGSAKFTMQSSMQLRWLAQANQT